MPSEESRTPQGASGHQCKQVCGHNKGKAVSIIIINTTKQKYWLQQTLLHTELFTSEYYLVEHRVSLERKGDDFDISFLQSGFKMEQEEVTSIDISLLAPLINNIWPLDLTLKPSILTLRHKSACLSN